MSKTYNTLSGDNGANPHGWGCPLCQIYEPCESADKARKLAMLHAASKHWDMVKANPEMSEPQRLSELPGLVEV